MAYTTINKPSLQFNTVLRNGGGGTITGVGFQPDLVWQKARSTASSHYLHDAVRGVTKALFTNSTSSETTYTDQITSFDTDGFTVDAGGDWGSGTTVVDWCWKANGAGVSNTQGSITSTVSANTTSGFSIVSYTSDGNSGATVGHGLGVAPKMVIVKRRNSAEDWGVGHTSLGWTKFIRLNTTGAEATSTGLWNDTAPSSTVVTLGNSGISNVGSGTTMIMYCFAEVKGFSKFGSYSGNGSTDGTFVYTGFKPAWVVVKNITETDGWILVDNKRNTFNVETNYLQPNSSNADASATISDFLSNGFKLRETFHGTNQSGQTYIYAAFAEQPLVGTNNVPATAR